MIECYAKKVNNQITEVSSGIGTSGTWIKIEGYEGEDQTLTYDVLTNTVKVEDKIDEKPVATIEELVLLSIVNTKLSTCVQPAAFVLVLV